MAKTSYFAIDANGAEHTRKSARVYTHTVVFKYSAAGLIAHNAKYTGSYRKTNLDNHAFYTREAVSPKYCDPYPSETTEANAARIQRTKDEAAQWLAKNGTDAEAYADRCEAKFIEGCYEREAAGFTNAGWCGRLDLAQKLADQYRGDPFYRDVTILEAQTK